MVTKESRMQEVAMDFMRKNDHNFYAIDLRFNLILFGRCPFYPESIWYSKDEDKIYIHGCCSEFEGDIDIDSLSEMNKEVLENALESRI